MPKLSPTNFVWILEFLQTQGTCLEGRSEDEIISLYVEKTRVEINKHLKLPQRSEEEAKILISLLLERSKIERSPEKEEHLEKRETQASPIWGEKTEEDFEALALTNPDNPLIKEAQEKNSKALKLAIAVTFSQVSPSIWKSKSIAEMTLKLSKDIEKLL